MIRCYYLDANALVKLVVQEAYSDNLRNYLCATGRVFATTSFCFYEALGVLKAKQINKNRPDHIHTEQYFCACEDLCALVRDENIQIEESSFYNYQLFSEAMNLAEKYSLDLSDGFQLVTLKEGMFARLSSNLPIILISGDKDLLSVATQEGLECCNVKDL